ncbi:MAG: hypothetical protein JNJ90_11705 [Saprospiraceae bacterium]|nr:hypothetical protein [Saprospiraceae bacterium]
MQRTSTTSTPLNEVQLMLLRLFSRPMTKSDTEAIRKMLLDYYETLLQQEVDKVMEGKGIVREDFDRLLNEDKRSR